jgi:hypothetical protein
MGEWHVSMSGSDTASTYAGNGSAACPVQTISRAVALAQADGLSATIYIDKGTYEGVSFAPLAGQTLTLKGSAIADVVIVSPIGIDGPPGAAAQVSTLTLSQPPGSNGTGIDVFGNVDVVVTNVASNMVMVFSSTGRGTFGPGIVLSGGYGIQSTTTANVSVVGSPTAPTIISVTGVCISQVPTVSGNVTLQNCGDKAIEAGTTVSGVVVQGGGNGLAPAIEATTISDVQINGWQGDGISCAGCAITGNVQVTGTLLGTGVRVISGAASVNGLFATGNHGDGLRCEGTASLKLRGSVLNGNDGSGLLAIGGCTLDLGSAADPGNNVFNRTSAKNGVSGLCLLPSAASRFSLASCDFSCGYSGAGCTQTGSPSTMMASSCQTADITLGPGASLQPSNLSCCD